MALRPTSALYKLEAFGIANPWLVWQIERGGLDDLCPACGGGGVEITSPCARREIRQGAFTAECIRATGCPKCRRRCGTCYGRGMPAAAVHAEDFGEDDSRAIAEQAFPGIAVSPLQRLDMDAPALGGG